MARKKKKQTLGDEPVYDKLHVVAVAPQPPVIRGRMFNPAPPKQDLRDYRRLRAKIVGRFKEAAHPIRISE